MAGLRVSMQRLAYALRNSGWPTKIGLVLLLSACLMVLGLLSQWRQQQALQAKLAKPVPTASKQTAAHSTQDIAVKFFELLPKTEQADALSADILKTADGLGLRFERAEFSATQHAETRLVQHQIRLPVRGTYMQVRQFLNALLNAHPTLALTEMQIHREDVFTDAVEANLVLTLYMQGDVPW